MHGSGEVEQYEDASALRDPRPFAFGEIWIVRDALLTLPDADRVKVPARQVHPYRPVVIVSNHEGNTDPDFHVVQVATLSTRTDLKKPWDLLLEPEDGVRSASVVRPATIQPVCKLDLKTKKGVLSDDKKAELLIQLQLFFGLLPE